MTDKKQAAKNESHSTKNKKRTTTSESPIYQPPAMNTDSQKPATLGPCKPLSQGNSLSPVEASSTEPRSVEASSTGPRPVQASFTGCEEDEINLLDYLRVIYKNRWMIMLLTILTMGATVAMSLSKPRMYQANTSIVPPIDSRSQGGGLAGKLGGIGSGLLQGMLNEQDLSGLYVGLLESRAVSEALVDKFDLQKVYSDKEDITRTDARGILKDNTTIKASKEGIVHITVRDLDATRAADIANAYVEELDIQNKRLSGGQATSKRVFLENRLKEIQGELSKIDSLQSRDVQVKEMLYELLSNECEMAKIEEAKSMPTIQVLDKAIVPEEGMGRGTVKKGILAGIATMMLGIFVAFGREYVAGVRAGM